MDYKAIQSKSVKDLEKLLGESREELRGLRFKLAANQLADVRSVREVKRAIAKIQTRLSQLRNETTEANASEQPTA